MRLVNVTACELMHTPIQNKRGYTLIAKFTVEFSGVRISGCSLQIAPDGRIFWACPAFHKGRGHLYISDKTLYEAIAAEGWKAFEAMGGETPPLGSPAALPHGVCQMLDQQLGGEQ